jgi:hypothetical protein
MARNIGSAGSLEPEIVATFLRGLGEIGFIDGQNVRIEALPIRANSRLMHRSK